VLYTPRGPVAIEWETGNISSSHRALNKMALGLMKRLLIAGVLIVPSRKLYKFLTDRVGNFDELAPYLDLWAAVPCSEGVLEIVVVEQDAESKRVPKIPKGTDGRALR
jgi:Restriction endonuclease BamHI